MKTSLFKELRELVLPFVGLLLVAYFAVEAVLVDGEVLISPSLTPNHAEARFALMAVLALAFWQFAGERLRGTHAYLVLRGIGRGHLFVAKAGAGLIAVATAFGLSLGFHLMVLTQSPEAPLFEAMGVWEVVSLLVVVLPVYAIGALLAVGWNSGPRDLLGRVALSILASSGLVMGVPQILGSRLGSERLVLQACLFAIVLGFSLWLARARFSYLADADVPEPPLRVRLRAALLLLLVIGQLRPMVGRCQWFLRNADSHTAVVDENGRFAELIQPSEWAEFQVVNSSGELLEVLEGPPFPLHSSQPATPHEIQKSKGWRRVPKGFSDWFEHGDPRGLNLTRLGHSSRYGARSESRLVRGNVAVGEGVMGREILFSQPRGQVLVRYRPHVSRDQSEERTGDQEFDQAARLVLEGPRLSEGTHLRRRLNAETTDLPTFEDPATGTVAWVSEVAGELQLVKGDRSDLAPPEDSSAVLERFPVTTYRLGKQTLMSSKGQVVEDWRAPATRTWQERMRSANFAMVTALKPTLHTVLGTLQPTGLPPLGEPGVRIDEPYRPDPRWSWISPDVVGFRRPGTSLLAIGLTLLATLGVARRERGSGRWFWIGMTAVVGLAGWVTWWIARAPARREAAARKAIASATEAELAAEPVAENSEVVAA